jgi:hypothetical protein
VPLWPPLLPADKPTSIKHKVNKNILISTLIYWFYQNPLTAALKQTWARLPTTQTVWIHWIHAAGGASGSITVEVVFVGCLCCYGQTRDVTSSSYVKNGTKITLRWGYFCNILTHPCVHHTFCKVFSFIQLWSDNKLIIIFLVSKKGTVTNVLLCNLSVPLIGWSALEFSVFCVEVRSDHLLLNLANLSKLGEHMYFWISWQISSYRSKLALCFMRRSFNSFTAIMFRRKQKLPPHRIPTVGIVQKVPSTTNTTIRKHHHHGRAVCSSYSLVGNSNFWFQYLGPPSEAEFRFHFWFRRFWLDFFLNSAVEKSANWTSDSEVRNSKKNT